LLYCENELDLSAVDEVNLLDIDPLPSDRMIPELPERELCHLLGSSIHRVSASGISLRASVRFSFKFSNASIPTYRIPAAASLEVSFEPIETIEVHSQSFSMTDFESSSVAADQRLTGPANFGRWVRDFRAVAVEKEFWDLYTGEEKVLVKPDVEAFLKGSPYDLHIRVIDFEFALEEYKDNKTRVSGARALLARWVDPPISYEVLEKKTPKDAYDHILTTYKLSDERSLEIAEKRVIDLSFDTTAGLTVFLNELKLLQDDIKDAGGIFTDKQFIDKVIRSLPAGRYGGFLQAIFQDTKGFEPPTRGDLIHKLMRFEVGLPLMGLGDANNTANKKQSGKGKFRNKCTDCGKWGHVSDKCWITHPEMRP
jgi:hypothetical protein